MYLNKPGTTMSIIVGHLFCIKALSSLLNLSVTLVYYLKKFRIVLSQLRLSAHHLRIETGRYAHNRADRALRLCTLCDRSDIEDEYQFVLICPVYSQIRQKYIRLFYYLRPSVYKFIKLMQSNQINVLRNLGKYVYESFAIRKSLIR